LTRCPESSRNAAESPEKEKSRTAIFDRQTISPACFSRMGAAPKFGPKQSGETPNERNPLQEN